MRTAQPARPLSSGAALRPPQPPAPPLSAGEVLLALLATAAALLIRLWEPGGLGIDHYDEGVYVTSANALLPGQGGLFPNQVVFSPPFYFGVAGLLLRLFGGAPDQVAILLNVVLGTLTVAAVWLVGRRWYGAAAGLCAAVFIAASPLHVMLSRAALTDVAFAFWFLLAIAVAVTAVERRHFGIAVAAGLLTGLAWNTKYHGWFVLVITGVALVPSLWSGRRDGSWRRPAAVWLLIAAVGGLSYLPWAVSMRDTSAGGGGYGGIVRYFAAMLRTQWFENVARHAAQQNFLETALSRAAPLVALAGALAGSGKLQDGFPRIAAAAAVLGVAGVLTGTTGAIVVMAMAALPILLREFGAYRSRVLICWVGLWVTAAPFYHPYARLLLPFVIALALLAGAALARWVGALHHPFDSAGAGKVGQWKPAAAAAALALVVFLVVGLFDRAGGNPWRARGVGGLASQMDASVPRDGRIYVLGEPSLAFHLRRLGRDVPADLRPQALDTLTAPAYIVAGVYADRAPQLRDGLAAFGQSLRRFAVFEFDPGDLRLLDDLRPGPAQQYRAARDTTFDLTVYHLVEASGDKPEP